MHRPHSETTSPKARSRSQTGNKDRRSRPVTPVGGGVPTVYSWLVAAPAGSAGWRTGATSGAHFPTERVTASSIDSTSPRAPWAAAQLRAASRLSKKLMLVQSSLTAELQLEKQLPDCVALQVRGNPVNEGPKVPRRFLAVLSAKPPRSP